MKIRSFKIALGALFLLSVQSTGYDIYAHSLIYYFNNEEITHSYTLFLDNLIMPRYGLLSLIYEITRAIGIPLGWVALTLVVVPVISIANKLCCIKYIQIHGTNAHIWLFSVLLIYFYSGTSLVLLWLMAFLVTNKNFFLIGSFFHPVGFLLGFFASFLSKTKIYSLLYYIYIFSCLVSILFLNSYYGKFLSSTSLDLIKFHIGIKEFIDLINYSYEYKSNEINGFALLFLFSYFTRKKIVNLIGILNFPTNLIKLLIISFSMFLFFNALIREANSLVRSMIFIDVTDSIYTTWFSIGARDLSLYVWNVNETRYK